MADFIDTLPNPDIVGESLYRALHEELTDWFTSMPEDDQAEVARSFAADLRENAKVIDAKVTEFEKAERSTNLAAELETAGWPSVAEDAREGLHPETILRRLHGIGEGESTAAEIVAKYT